MSVCWYCHWGWPSQVVAIFNDAKNQLEEIGGDGYDLLFGPAHIVWEDENFEEGHIRFCIEECDKDMGMIRNRYDPAAMAIVKQSLEQLLALPRAIRECEPDDYDDENPENFPPAVGLTMVHRSS